MTSEGSKRKVMTMFSTLGAWFIFSVLGFIAWNYLLAGMFQMHYITIWQAAGAGAVAAIALLVFRK